MRFSPTGRAFAVAATSGLLVYSLDEDNTFDPTDLDLELTPQAVRAAARTACGVSSRSRSVGSNVLSSSRLYTSSPEVAATANARPVGENRTHLLRAVGRALRRDRSPRCAPGSSGPRAPPA